MKNLYQRDYRSYTADITSLAYSCTVTKVGEVPDDFPSGNFSCEDGRYHPDCQEPDMWKSGNHISILRVSKKQVIDYKTDSFKPCEPVIWFSRNKNINNFKHFDDNN